jgi:hypothetical protein
LKKGAGEAGHFQKPWFSYDDTRSAQSSTSALYVDDVVIFVSTTAILELAVRDGGGVAH